MTKKIKDNAWFLKEVDKSKTDDAALNDFCIQSKTTFLKQDAKHSPASYLLSEDCLLEKSYSKHLLTRMLIKNKSEGIEVVEGPTDMHRIGAFLNSHFNGYAAYTSTIDEQEIAKDFASSSSDVDTDAALRLASSTLAYPLSNLMDWINDKMEGNWVKFYRETNNSSIEDQAHIIVGQLLNQGADPNLFRKQYINSFVGLFSGMKLKMKYDGQDATSSFGAHYEMSPLAYSVFRNSPNVFSKLLQNGADISGVALKTELGECNIQELIDYSVKFAKKYKKSGSVALKMDLEKLTEIQNIYISAKSSANANAVLDEILDIGNNKGLKI